MEDILEHHRAWIEAFDQCVIDDQWERLHPFLDPDVRYIVSGTPFACTLKGRDAVLSGLAKSIRNFDRYFDQRGWTPVWTRVYPPNAIHVLVHGEYRKKGLPPLRIPVLGQWYYHEGKIDCMVDIYDDALADMEQAYQWLAEHPGVIDPSYV